MKADTAPWDDRQAIEWLMSETSWLRFTQLIQHTLEQDARRFPHQVRAAAAMVILLCRKGLWPARGGVADRDELASMARRQLSQIKQQFSVEARNNPEVYGSVEFRALMKTLDEEMRILDARVSDRPLNIPDEPPGAWGPW